MKLLTYGLDSAGRAGVVDEREITTNEVIPGVDHATFGGPSGARVLNLSVGLAPHR